MEDFIIFLQNGNIEVKMPSHSMVLYRKIYLSIPDNNRVIH